MKRWLLYGCLILVSSVSIYLVNVDHASLKPFTTDGCSSFPDGTFEYKDLWQACCVAHDQAYWLGGSYQRRLEADKQLRECVSKVGQAKIAALMMAGVRVGGSPFWPTRYRWGYGWPYPRGYKVLTNDEKRLSEAMNYE